MRDHAKDSNEDGVIRRTKFLGFVFARQSGLIGLPEVYMNVVSSCAALC